MEVILHAYISDRLLLLLRSSFKDIVHDLYGVTGQLIVHLVHVLVVVKDLPEEREKLLVDYRLGTHCEYFNNNFFKKLCSLTKPGFFFLSNVYHKLLDHLYCLSSEGFRQSLKPQMRVRGGYHAVVQVRHKSFKDWRRILEHGFCCLYQER